jgi:hypothetical protein
VLLSLFSNVYPECLDREVCGFGYWGLRRAPSPLDTTLEMRRHRNDTLLSFLSNTGRECCVPNLLGKSGAKHIYIGSANALSPLLSVIPTMSSEASRHHHFATA